MAGDWAFERVAGPYGAVAEGPAWDGRFVYFTLIQQSAVMRFDPSSGECSVWCTGTGRTNGLAFDAQGRLHGCSIARQAIVRFEPDGASSVVVDRLEGRRLNTPNDLAIGRGGEIWFSNPWNEVVAEEGQTRELPDEPVVCARPRPGGGHSVARAASDTSNPNGVLLSADERTLYVSQCDYAVGARRELRAYPVDDDGHLGAFTVLHTFGEDHRGVHRAIDGMCLDADGNVVAAAGWEVSGPGPMIYVFSPSGRVLETHPCERPTNCTFGDRDLQTLYVTTGAGSLLRARTRRRGWSLHR